MIACFIELLNIVSNEYRVASLLGIFVFIKILKIKWHKLDWINKNENILISVALKSRDKH